jgi:ribosomal protein S18 acetylase RimI-like enzyme
VVISFRPATQDEAQRWLSGWRRRLDDWYGGHGAAALTRRADMWEKDPGEVHALVEPTTGAVVGFVAVAIRDGMTLISDIWVEPNLRGRAYGRAGRRFAEEWAAQHEPRLGIVLATDDPAAAALAADLPLRAQKMVKRLEEPEAPHMGVTVRPMTEVEYGPWLARKIDEWTEQVSHSGLATAEEAQRQSVEAFREMLPDGLASPGYTWLCLDDDTDKAVTTIWLKPQFAPGMSWVYSVETRPEHRGRGYGLAAMLAGERATLEAGDTYLGLNVFGHNTAAIRLYDRMGYVVVEQVRTT